MQIEDVSISASAPYDKQEVLFDKILELYSSGWTPDNYVEKNNAVLALIREAKPNALFLCTKRQIHSPDFFPYQHFYSPLEHLIFAAIGFQPGGVKGSFDLRPYPLVFIRKNMEFPVEQLLHAKDTLEMALLRMQHLQINYAQTFIHHYENTHSAIFQQVSPEYSPRSLIGEAENQIRLMCEQVHLYLARNAAATRSAMNGGFHFVGSDPNNALAPHFHQKRKQGDLTAQVEGALATQMLGGDEELTERPSKVNKSGP